MTKRLIIDGNAVYELDETYKLQKVPERERQVESDKIEGTESNHYKNVNNGQNQSK